MNNFSVPDVLGLDADEAVDIIQRHGFVVAEVNMTKSPKNGQPQGGCRVVRQRFSGQEVKLVLSYEKWVCG